MSEPENISAIIISYNGREFIADCLATLKENLTDFNHEIIIVDNNSTDGTIEYIDENYAEAKLLRNNKNLGFARAVNQGIKAAQFNLLWILNQDIKIRPGCLQSLLNCFKDVDYPGVIGPKFVGFDGTLQHSCRRLPRYRYMWFEMTGLAYIFPRSRLFNGWKMGEFDHLTSRPVEQPMGAAMLVSREAVEKVGLMDEAFPVFLNDVDFCRRFREQGYQNFYCADAAIEHYVGGSTSRRKVVMVWHSHLSVFRYFRKGEKRRKSLWTRLIFMPVLYLTGLALLITAGLRSLYYLFKHLPDKTHFSG